MCKTAVLIEHCKQVRHWRAELFLKVFLSFIPLFDGRAQLVVCVNHMVKQDFPEKWPTLVDKIVVCLSSDKENTWFGAISCAYQIVKKYR